MNGEQADIGIKGVELDAGILPAAPLRPKFYDILADEPLSARPSAEFASENGGRTDEPAVVREPRVMLEFFTPTELSAYQVPEGSNLVGNYHIVRGGIFVIGGAPGVGKSRAAVALAVAGATGADWFGLKVHRKFRTMILQAENGRIRLKLELGDLDCAVLNEWVLVSAVPPYGFAMTDRDFLAQFRAAILKFKPDILNVDPWNQCVKDSMEKDYWEGFERLRSCLPAGDDCPALGIVAHTRKPRMGERASGRSLLNLLSGSYVLTSVPRAVFVIQPASDDTEDRRIVFTNCKNNDGELSKRSVWERRNGLFAPVKEFNWEEFDSGGKPPRKEVTEAHIRQVFQNGNAKMLLKAAAEKLQETADVGRTVAYEALKPDGEFGWMLDRRSDRTIGLVGGGGN
jgi:hypothetical protein